MVSEFAVRVRAAHQDRRRLEPKRQRQDKDKDDQRQQGSTTRTATRRQQQSKQSGATKAGQNKQGGNTGKLRTSPGSRSTQTAVQGPARPASNQGAEQPGPVRQSRTAISKAKAAQNRFGGTTRHRNSRPAVSKLPGRRRSRPRTQRNEVRHWQGDTVARLAQGRQLDPGLRRQPEACSASSGTRITRRPGRYDNQQGERLGHGVACPAFTMARLGQRAAAIRAY